MEEDGERGLALNIGEIARRAHVSTATVSRTLNQTGTVRPETARKVWRVAAELNYYPNSHARALVSGRTVPVWFSVRETVAVETLARRAI